MYKDSVPPVGALPTPLKADQGLDTLQCSGGLPVEKANE